MKKSLGAIVASIDTSDAEPGDVLITVFNPTAQARDDVVECCVDMPRAGQEPYGPFSIEDPAGATVLQQVLGREQSYLIATEQSFLPDDLRDVEMARGVRSAGTPAARVRHVPRAPDRRAAEGQLRHAACAANSMENEFLRVDRGAERRRSPWLHKASGETYRNLNFFEDAGECGDPWWRWAPPDDRVVDVAGLRRGDRGRRGRTRSHDLLGENPPSPSDGRCGNEDAPAGGGAGTDDHELRDVEEGRAADRSAHRGGQHGGRPSLADAGRGGIPRVGNRMPTCRSTWSNAPCTSRHSEQLEAATGTHPMNGFHGVANGRRGLAILARTHRVRGGERRGRHRGNDSSAHLPVPEDERLVEDRVKRVGNEGSQMRGEQTFRYAFYVHAGDWEDAGALRRRRSSAVRSFRPITAGTTARRSARRTRFSRSRPPSSACRRRSCRTGRRRRRPPLQPDGRLDRRLGAVRGPDSQRLAGRAGRRTGGTARGDREHAVAFTAPRKKIVTLRVEFEDGATL